MDTFYTSTALALSGSFMKSRLFTALATVSICFSVSACNPTLRSHGYVADNDKKPQEVNPESDTKATVLSRLGNPSIRSTFDENTWFYISSVRETLAYLEPSVEERTITAITFNDDGQVQKVAEYGIEDGRYVDYSKNKTPTRGRELSVLEQIFGSIGRIPTQQIGREEDIPGGRGGRR